MDPVVLVKRATTVIVGFGISKIVNGVVANNTDPERILEKVSITAGSYVVGAMIADATRSFTDSKIDSVVAWWKKNIKKQEDITES